MLVKIAGYMDFCVYRRSYLIRSPVVGGREKRRANKVKGEKNIVDTCCAPRVSSESTSRVLAHFVECLEFRRKKCTVGYPFMD